MTELTGKVAIVTGAGRGLGRAMARALAHAGAAVAVASRTKDELDSFVEEVRAAGGKALACPTDITDEESVNGMVEATMLEFGRIDILVNNSGIVASTPLLEQPVEEWDQVISTNLRGVFLASKAAGRHMVAQGSGKVINIASNFALQGVVNHAAYSASKGGVLALTRSMAIEWARSGVQVNAIAPGYFATDLNRAMDEDLTEKVVRAIPARRMGIPAEIQPWVLLLASTASDFMTGETIVIDGGQTVR
ncbi:MAG: 2-deoxy-D-gluconate 3-dehydrogenase [Cryobacterium sp.]|jgi:NAD(P)-dependent dehydrogenase (short-subunit alcohol dehydrogenase family)|nr:2-deoxy-D-gluconate 3-dehydrogenase [Cryobacterium sp.]